MARYADRQSPERQLIRQTRKREKERVSEPLRRFERRLLSALLHARIHLVARRVSKSVVSLNYSWRVFFSATADHRPPSTQRRGEGLLVKTSARWIRNTRCRWKISAIIGRPLIIHLSPANRNEFLRRAFRRFRICANIRYVCFCNPSIKFRTEWIRILLYILKLEIRDSVENIWIRNTLFDK